MGGYNMAYVTKGFINTESLPQQYPKKGTYHETIIIDDSNYALYVTQDNSKQNPWEVYTLYAYPLNKESATKNCHYVYETLS